MIVLHEHMYVHDVHAWCPQKSEEGIRSPGMVVNLHIGAWNQT